MASCAARNRQGSRLCPPNAAQVQDKLGSAVAGAIQQSSTAVTTVTAACEALAVGSACVLCGSWRCPHLAGQLNLQAWLHFCLELPTLHVPLPSVAAVKELLSLASKDNSDRIYHGAKAYM